MESDAAGGAGAAKSGDRESGVLTRASVADFTFGALLGEGAYARVVHARLRASADKDFAVKIMDKRFIQKENKVHPLVKERRRGGTSTTRAPAYVGGKD